MKKAKFDERVKSYLDSVRERIIKDYSISPGEWSAQLKQLEDLYSAYLRCADDIPEEEIIVFINDGKTASPNPKLRLMMELSKSMDQIIKGFGLSPLAKSRIKATLTVAEQEDFLDSL